jgi:16S rRNA (cytidine1402-2'-O)-methyltransferase
MVAKVHTPAGESGEEGTLILAAVPIGQADDASPRLRSELARVPVIAAEDTRKVRGMAARLGVELSAKIVSYYDAVETRRTPALIAELEAGQDVLLVTDAGMPGISDPGYRLVQAAAARNIRVTALPGPSAVTTALAVSGLPTDRFCFEGFPPRKQGERNRRFAELAEDKRTQVFFESPRRLPVTLAELAKSHGEDRQAVVCRELTKTHEEVRRGTLAELSQWAQPAESGRASSAVRGEITLVVAGTGRLRRTARDSTARDGTARDGTARDSTPADGWPPHPGR